MPQTDLRSEVELPDRNERRRGVSYIAAFRTYGWDATIDELAARFFRACPSGHHIVLADESRGVVPMPKKYRKLSHSEDTGNRLGLPAYPAGRSLWYNVDYGLYFLYEAMPAFDHYVSSESDLAVNLSLEPMLRFAFEEKIDLITHRVKPSTPAWYWHRNGRAVFESPWQSLLCLMVLSNRAVKTLLAARQELARRFGGGALRQWPFCEAFVPSMMVMLGGARIARLEDFALTENLRYRQ
jgi:hypothetical protein